MATSIAEKAEFTSEVLRWVTRGTISSDQARALIEESKRHEEVDPYEGTYLDGPPANAWPTWAERVWVVNAYTLTRQYGGPEEGGWWYTHAHPERIAAGPFHSVADAEEVRDDLAAFADVEEREGNMYSVLGGQQVELRVESCIPHFQVPSVYC